MSYNSRQVAPSTVVWRRRHPCSGLGTQSAVVRFAVLNRIHTAEVVGSSPAAPIQFRPTKEGRGGQGERKRDRGDKGRRRPTATGKGDRRTGDGDGMGRPEPVVGGRCSNATPDVGGVNRHPISIRNTGYRSAISAS